MKLLLWKHFAKFLQPLTFNLFDPLVVVAIRISQEPFFYAEMT